MKTKYLRYISANLAMTSFVTACSCRATEVSYLETFDTFPYSWISTNEHALFTDWPNGDLTTANSNGVLQAWSSFAPFKASNPMANLKSIVLHRSAELQPGRDLELRATILKLSGNGAYAALGWQQEGLYEIGYFLLKGADDVILVKHRFDQKIFAPLFWERLTVNDVPVTLVLRFSGSESNLTLQVQLLDSRPNGLVIFDRTIIDTSQPESVSATPLPVAASPDPGPAWQGNGRISLSLFGFNTNSARLDMNVDDFGMRQTREVTENDFLPLVYSNTPGGTLSYRLFTPALLEAGALYPLVLHLHSRDGVGNDNLRQFNHPGVLVFLSQENQKNHPCFMVSPQVSTKDYTASNRDDLRMWWILREKVTGLLAQLIAQYPIDSNRLHLTGESMGAIGCWSYLAEYPDRFASAVPIAGLAAISSIKRITLQPIWAFHGTRDKTIAVDLNSGAYRGSRGMIAELRRLGASPIYTEYDLASHVMYSAAYETPGLVDWVMAQRLGAPVMHSSSPAVTAPSTSNAWTTSYTNVNLAGTVRVDTGITNVVWQNQTLNRIGPAEGVTNWIATTVPLRLGQAASSGIMPATNLITLTATGPSGSSLYGGVTTFATTWSIQQVPIRLQVRSGGAQTRLEWTGAAPSFMVQRCWDLGMADWVNVTATSETNIALPQTGHPEFFRINLP